MKTNKKLIVSSLATVMGLSLVGAITGTVAWYQYSTRSTLAFVGTSVKSGANLQMQLGGKSATGGYKSDWTSSQVASYLASISQNANLSPITTGVQAKNAELETFKTNPSYKDFEYAKWADAAATEYVQFTVALKYTAEVDGVAQSGAAVTGKKIWLNNALFQHHANDEYGDLSKALRVHLHTSTANLLLSKAGGSTDVYGQLDLNNDGVMDGNATWSEFESNTPANYGADSGVQTAYKIGDTGEGNVVEPTNTNGALSGGVVLGTTDSDGVLEVTITIWLEGWQKLDKITSVKPNEGIDVSHGYYTDRACTTAATGNADGNTTYYQKAAAAADWNEAIYLGAQFDLGLEFVSER